MLGGGGAHRSSSPETTFFATKVCLHQNCPFTLITYGAPTTTGLAPAPLHMAMRALAALLCLSAASARILEDEIKQLPGWNEALPSRHFSGCEPPPVPPPRLSLFVPATAA
jgi:hypothetical protein